MFSLYLLNIFEASIESGKLPAAWKKAFVVPLHKKGDKSNAENYRPISLTSGCCRLFEHLLADYINMLLDKLNLFFPGQHGFRAGFSGESQLCNLIQKASVAFEKTLNWMWHF